MDAMESIKSIASIDSRAAMDLTDSMDASDSIATTDAMASMAASKLLDRSPSYYMGVQATTHKSKLRHGSRSYYT